MEIGGRVTLQRHGVEHFREIGRKGFESMVASKFQGDRNGAMRWLRNRAHEKKIDSFVDRELQRRLDDGAQIASMELPCLSDPDTDIPF